MNLSDYKNAIKVASLSKPTKIPKAALSVLWSRLLYKIGPRHHSLFGFGIKPMSEWRTYIPDHESNPIIRAVNKTENLALAEDKLRFEQHCKINNLPTIPILAVIANNLRGSTLDTPKPTNPAQLNQILHDAPNRLFIKLIDGTHGDGAFVAERSHDGWNIKNTETNVTCLYQYCMDTLEGRRGWLLQPAIVPHPKLTKIMKINTLGTVRAVTYLTENGSRIILPLLKIPAGNNFSDNFSEGRTGNIIAKIDIATGILGIGKAPVSTMWPDIIDVEIHPDTGHRISGFQLPYWMETVHLMLRAQSSTPMLKSLGWDIAITEEGPIIVEANAGYCANILQVAYGRGIRKELTPILEMIHSSEESGPRHNIAV